MLILEVPITEIPLLSYEKYYNRLVTFQKRAEIILLLATQPYLQRQQIAQIVNVYCEREGFRKIIELNCRDKALPYLTTINNSKKQRQKIFLIQFFQFR